MHIDYKCQEEAPNNSGSTKSIIFTCVVLGPEQIISKLWHVKP